MRATEDAVVASRPLLSFAFTLAGGLLVLGGGLYFLAFPTTFGFLPPVGIACGTLLLVAAILLYYRPAQHSVWGILVLVFGIASLVNLGGFVLGMTFAVVGGALALAWTPEGRPQGGSQGWAMPAGPYGVPVTPWRLCMGCGRWIPWSYNVCPLCGTAAPLAPWVPRPSEAGAVPPPIAAPAPAATYAPPPAAAPPTPAPAEPPMKAPCPTCDGEAEWRPATQRWFCPTENRSF
ncbi:MAG TPA: DUF6114 domain-containing protein [Thermoplasmata archaeon]|nr:DUF6114 domain-containing protein [Thermoplasmata archaeon]